MVLLDLGLPDAQGLDTFIRAHAAMPDTPIVVLSGLGDAEVALQAVQMGAQDYLLKGASIRDVLPRAIRYAVERHQARQKLEHYARELREKNAMLEEELRMAREVQQALLPSQYPQFSDTTSSGGGCALRFAHHYRPAAALSGDFFDILPLSEHQAGVLICDVMGHGVRAAFIGALARGFILHATPLASNPGEFLSALNREMNATLKQLGTHAFATAFYLVADLAERQLRYANAGHPDPMILRRDAGSVDWLRVEGLRHLPLGLLGETVYSTFQTTLAERDSVLLFTDGAFEEEDAGGQPFGHERLLDATKRRLAQPCETVLDDVVHDIQQFSGHTQFADDLCLVGMDVVNGPPCTKRAA